MLQAGRLLVRVPDEVNFSNLPNPSSRTMCHGVDSASNRNEYQKRPARRADNLATIYELNV
jgi:hypothetical protein